jgi:hypothetical protein
MFNGEGRQTKLLNDYLIDESEGDAGEITGEGDINPPYRLDPFQNIVNRQIFLFVSLSGDNNSSSGGPYGPAPSVSKPTLEATMNAEKSGIRLLDTVKPAAFNKSEAGFQLCFPYLTGGDLVSSWVAAHGGGGRVLPVGGSCPVETTPGDPTVTSGPINYYAFAAATTFYLFAVPVGDDVVDLNIKGIIPEFNSGIDPVTYGDTNTGGSVAIDVRVYSRVNSKIWRDPKRKKITDLIDYLSDGNPRPTEDDKYSAAVTNSNQGKFEINIKLEKDEAKAQIDNYGKTFQPYKVTTKPAIGIDLIPSQPPIRLDTP